MNGPLLTNYIGETLVDRPISVVTGLLRRFCGGEWFERLANDAKWLKTNTHNLFSLSLDFCAWSVCNVIP